MVAAAATGQVIKGDKEAPSRSSMFNDGYVVDVGETGGCDVTGRRRPTDVNYV